MPTSGSYTPAGPDPGAVEGLIPSADDSFCFFTGPLLPPDDVTFSSSLEIVSAKLLTLALVLENFLRGNSASLDFPKNLIFGKADSWRNFSLEILLVQKIILD